MMREEELEAEIERLRQLLYQAVDRLVEIQELREEVSVLRRSLDALLRRFSIRL